MARAVEGLRKGKPALLDRCLHEHLRRRLKLRQPCFGSQPGAECGERDFL
jgi:hypothetical protein